MLYFFLKTILKRKYTLLAVFCVLVIGQMLPGLINVRRENMASEESKRNLNQHFSFSQKMHNGNEDKYHAQRTAFEMAHGKRLTFGDKITLPDDVKLHNSSRNIRHRKWRKKVLSGSATFLQLYKEHSNNTLVISPPSVLTDFTYYDILDLPKNQIKFLPEVKNPCFFAYTGTGSQVVLRCLPHIIVIGVAKCGTTDIYHKLWHHQQVFHNHKEIGWWVGGKDYTQKPQTSVNIAEYTHHFDNAVTDILQKGVEYFGKTHRPYYISEKVGMDNSPFYFAMKASSFESRRNLDSDAVIIGSDISVPQSIYHLLPNTKIMMILCEPGERAWSHYNMHVRNRGFNFSQETFHNIVSEEVLWFNACIEKHSKTFCAIERPYNIKDIASANSLTGKYVIPGLYSIYIQKWLDVFPKENIIFINLRHYSKNPVSYMQKNVLPLIGLEPYNEEVLENLTELNQPRNAHSKPSNMSRDTRELLDQFYLPYNEELKSLLGNDFTW